MFNILARLPWFEAINKSISFTCYLTIACYSPLVFSQIVPDETLGNESSILTPNVEIKGSPADRIDGGAVRGANLFHSFREFNIDTQQKVYFNNPAGIDNIITRITGNNQSTINGKLGVLGQGNLWLINPRGIVVGKNASLDLKGAFVATTADTIQFSQQGFFSASEPNLPSLLTVNPSALFFNQTASAPISYGLTGAEKVGQETNNSSGLQLANGQSLLLIGGEILVDSGAIKTKDGRVELAAVGNSKTVGLNINNHDISLNIPEPYALGNISINNSNIDVSGEAGGRIQMWGDRITFTEQTNINADTLGNQNGRGINIQARQLIIKDGSQISASAIEKTQGNSGGIEVHALELVELIGTGNQQQNQSGGGQGNNNSNGGGGGQGNNNNNNGSGGGQGGNNGDGGDEKPSKLASDARGEGQSGGLIINTARLRLLDGAKISSSTIDASGGGNILINASESVELSGASAVRQRPSGLSVQTRGDGKAGDLTINTRRLILQNGAEIAASTFGKGDGGNLIINASESVELIGALKIKEGNSPAGIGIAENGWLSSRLVAETGRPLNTKDEGLIIGTGKGGNLVITTDRLSIRDGAEISASSFSEGKGGDILVNASELVEIKGTAENNLLSSRLVAETGRPLRLSSGETLQGTGDGGNLTINTRTLQVMDDGQISVSSLGTKSGTSGNLEVNAASIQLNNQGEITATTLIGDGGDILLNVQDLLSMGNQSEISTSAGTAEAGGDGGNISINSPFLLALGEKNQITANAFQGKGGNIQITTNAIFGSEVLNISASSALGIDGTVAINTPEVDPTSGLVALASNLIDAQKLIAQNACMINTENNSFVITGRGGLPPSPYEILSPNSTWEDWRLTANSSEKIKETTTTVQPNSAIVEAQGWVVTAGGKVMLTAKPVVVTPQRSWFPHLRCS